MVIIDATGNRLQWRQLARELIPEFYEVYLKCPLAVCMEREGVRIERHGAPADVYAKGKRGSPVPGIRTPYEEPVTPDIVIETDQEPLSLSVERIVKLVGG